MQHDPAAASEAELWLAKLDAADLKLDSLSAELDAKDITMDSIHRGYQVR